MVDVFISVLSSGTKLFISRLNKFTVAKTAALFGKALKVKKFTKNIQINFLKYLKSVGANPLRKTLFPSEAIAFFKHSFTLE